MMNQGIRNITYLYGTVIMIVISRTIAFSSMSISMKAGGNNNRVRYSVGKLARPQVLYSNNHILCVNKPAGWITVAHSDNTLEQRTNQCLLSNLKEQSLGGGSQSDFLKPLHRIDQPCSGAVLYAKNGKAATRVSNAWKKGQVHKEYYCVVESKNDPHRSLKQILMDTCTLVRWSNNNNNNDDDDDDDDSNKKHSNLFGTNDSWNGKDRFLISGMIRKSKNKNSRSMETKAIPLIKHEMLLHEMTSYIKKNSDTDKPNNAGGGGSSSRICHMEIRPLMTVTSPKEQTPYHLLAVRTFTGAKHQVRALLSGIAGLSISGDLRYGAPTNLPDKSVALHARKIYLPTVQLGGMEFLQDEPFVAPIPDLWKSTFGMTEKMISKIESR